MRHRKRVFSSHVDIALACAYRVPGYGHSLEQRVRIAFQNRAVHESSRVAFVCIAHHVFGRTLSLASEIPLNPGWEPRPAATSEPGTLQSIDDLLRFHLSKRLAQCRIAVAGDVFVDVERVDNARVAQGDSLLPAEEGHGLLSLYDLSSAGFLIKKSPYYAPFHQVFVDDLLGIVGSELPVEDAFGVHDHDRPQVARTHAPCDNHLYFALNAFCGYLSLQRLPHRLAVGGDTGCAAAHKHVRSNQIHSYSSLTTPDGRGTVL